MSPEPLEQAASARPAMSAQMGQRCGGGMIGPNVVYARSGSDGALTRAPAAAGGDRKGGWFLLHEVDPETSGLR